MRWPILVLMVAAWGCHDWRKNIDSTQSQNPPIQQMFSQARIFEQEYKNHLVEFEALASYSLTAHVAAIDRGPIDEWDFVTPIDLAFIWGPLTKAEYVQHTKFHLAKRYVSVRYSPPQGGVSYPWNGNHSFANNHIIPATPEMLSNLKQLKPGDLVSLKGELVNLRIYGPNKERIHTMKTSLTRKDRGNGACENIWLKELYIHTPSGSSRE